MVVSNFYDTFEFRVLLLGIGDRLSIQKPLLFLLRRNIIVVPHCHVGDNNLFEIVVKFS